MAVVKVIAVANQKGGVAKTTTVQSLGVALARTGRRVLLVDLDPQACLTYSFGVDPDALEISLHDVLVRRAKIADVRIPVSSFAGLSLAPATIDLAGAEVHLLSRTGREHVLARALEPVLGDHDLVLIDCPPSLGVLTINGLTAAEAVLIPLQCEALSHRGVGQLLETIEDVRTFANEDLRVLGVLPTMFDGRTRHARQILDEVHERYGLRVFEPPVPKSVRFAEAPSVGQSIFEQHARQSGRRRLRRPGERGDRRPRRGGAMTPEPGPPAGRSRRQTRTGPTGQAVLVLGARRVRARRWRPGAPRQRGAVLRRHRGRAPGPRPARQPPRRTGSTRRGVLALRGGHADRPARLRDLSLPLGVWLPRGRFDRRMTCPSATNGCGRASALHRRR